MEFRAPQRVLSAVLCLGMLLTSAPRARLDEAGTEQADLTRGIALVNEGDFSAAVVTLAATLRALEAQTGSERRRAQAELYLGIAYLELDQEVMARTRFREALRLDPEMRLDPEQFSPQVLRTFEASRADAVAATAG